MGVANHLLALWKLKLGEEDFRPDPACISLKLDGVGVGSWWWSLTRGTYLQWSTTATVYTVFGKHNPWPITLKEVSYSWHEGFVSQWLFGGVLLTPSGETLFKLYVCYMLMSFSSSSTVKYLSFSLTFLPSQYYLSSAFPIKPPTLGLSSFPLISCGMWSHLGLCQEVVELSHSRVIFCFFRVLYTDFQSAWSSFQSHLQ